MSACRRPLCPGPPPGTPAGGRRTPARAGDVVKTMRASGIGGAIGAALAVALPSSGASGARLLPPPGVRPSRGWISETSGRTDPATARPQLFIVTKKPSDPRPQLPLSIFNGLRELAPSAALIWASTVSRGHFDHFEQESWPPRLARFSIQRAWEGQPEARIQQRLLPLSAGGWSLDLRVYFGTQHPKRALLAAVQAELDRMALP